MQRQELYGAMLDLGIMRLQHAQIREYKANLPSRTICPAPPSRQYYVRCHISDWDHQSWVEFDTKLEVLWKP